jgi:hypothetical protein
MNPGWIDPKELNPILSIEPRRSVSVSELWSWPGSVGCFGFVTQRLRKKTEKDFAVA